MSTTFSKQRSDARFERVAAEIHRVFAADPTAAEEAIELAKSMRTYARAEVIVKSTVSAAPTVDGEFADVFRIPGIGGSPSAPDPSVAKFTDATDESYDYIDAIVNPRRALLKSSTRGVRDLSWDEPLTA